MAFNKNKGLKIFSDTLIYMVSGLMLKGFSFFLLPLYTAYLSPTDYGITSITSSFLATTSFLTSLSLYSAVFRFYADLKNDRLKLRRFYGTIISFVMIITAGSILIMFLLKNWIITYIFVGIDFFPTIFLVIISLFFYCQYLIYENVLKSQQRAKKYAVVTTGYFFITLLANLIFVIQFNMGATGVLIANLITYILFTLVFWVDLSIGKSIEWCFDIKILKEALNYSIPIIPHNLSTQLAMFISKIFIGDIANLGAVGLYAIASQFANIADVVQNYVNSAYGPWLYEQLNEKKDDMKHKISMISSSLVYLLGFFLLGIALFTHDFIILFLSKSYVLAWMYVPLIVWVLLIKTIYYFYVEILFYHKNASRLIFISTLSSSLVNILLSYFAIKSFGIIGSIMADFISVLIRVILVVYLAQRFDDIGLRLKDFVLNILFISLFMLVGLYFSYKNYPTTFNLHEFLYRIGVMILYLFIIIYMNKKNFSFLVTRRPKVKTNE